MCKYKKPISLILTAALLVCVTSCSQSGEGNNGADTSDTVSSSSAPQSSFAEPNVADIDENAETGTITWLVYEDLLSSMSGMVNLFETRYGGSIEQQMTSSGSAYFDKLGSLIAIGDSPDIVRYEWRAFPHGMSYNMYTPLDSYIDLDSELWKGVKPVAEQYVYNGKHYYVPNSLDTNFALNYNNRVLEENGMEDPMEMLNNGTWTWSAFEAMLKQWVDMDSDHIGYNGVGGMIFVMTTGTKTIDITDGNIVNNLKNENVNRCMLWLENMRKQGLLGASAEQQARGMINGYVDPGAAFVDGNLLFLGMNPSWAYGAAKESLDKAGLENEMKFVPFPRDELADTYYQGGNTIGFMIPAGAHNVKGALDWITLNRIEETDEDNIAGAKALAISDAKGYYPKCANADCNDTSDSRDDKNRHIFTDEENAEGMSTCPSCGEARREKYKVVWSEEQYDLFMEMKSTDGRFTLLFDNVYGFNDDVSNLLIGTGSLLDAPVFEDESYTNLVDTLYNSVESYIDFYRNLMKSGGGAVTALPDDNPAG
ncbi:MAG: carbohydrate ABC transporter substrate-binding protein [Ruminococcaceae bacterium]|nr:carbohydrate ABC transporter substrate-binding protein [Oscillospiraceae bacterium]